MNFGTRHRRESMNINPARIMQQLGTAELAIDIRHLLNGSLLQSVV